MNKRDATKLAAEVVRPLALYVPADKWDDLVKSIIDVFMDCYDHRGSLPVLVAAQLAGKIGERGDARQ